MDAAPSWFTPSGALRYAAFQDAIDACAESAPLVSVHNEPQVSPQEWDCGCVTACYVTDRERNEKPFEMRVARACLKPETCKTLPLIRDHAYSCGSNYCDDPACVHAHAELL